MHNREPVTLGLLWKSLKDFDLWPLYMLGLMFQIPTIPQSSYLTLTLKGLGFSTFNVSLLTIPLYLLRGESTTAFEPSASQNRPSQLLTPRHPSTVMTMLGLTYLSEAWNELSLTAMLGQIWTLPLLVAMVAINLATVNDWVLYAILLLLLAYPGAHPIHVGWNSRNANAVRTRTVSAACYNMFVQAGAIIGANIYRAGKLVPTYKPNLVLSCLTCVFGLVCRRRTVLPSREQRVPRDWGPQHCALSRGQGLLCVEEQAEGQTLDRPDRRPETGVSEQPAGRGQQETRFPVCSLRKKLAGVAFLVCSVELGMVPDVSLAAWRQGGLYYVRWGDVINRPARRPGPTGAVSKSHLQLLPICKQYKAVHGRTCSIDDLSRAACFLQTGTGVTPGSNRPPWHRPTSLCVFASSSGAHDSFTPLPSASTAPFPFPFPSSIGPRTSILASISRPKLARSTSLPHHGA